MVWKGAGNMPIVVLRSVIHNVIKCNGGEMLQDMKELESVRAHGRDWSVQRVLCNSDVDQMRSSDLHER